MVIYIDYIRLELNLADPLMKELTSDKGYGVENIVTSFIKKKKI